jgi:hypothetical protein
MNPWLIRALCAGLGAIIYYWGYRTGLYHARMKSRGERG